MARLLRSSRSNRCWSRIGSRNSLGAEKQVSSQKPNACPVQRGDALGADSLSAQSHEPRSGEGQFEETQGTESTYADEFRKVLENISEPFRTMCIVAMCLGLRVSEILGLKWRDIDWGGSRIAIRQAYVYGVEGDVKSQASHRWMPLDRSARGEASPLRGEIRSVRGFRRLGICKPLDR